MVEQNEKKKIIRILRNFDLDPWGEKRRGQFHRHRCPAGEEEWKEDVFWR